MNKFYIFLGNRSGNVFFLKKMFRNQIEIYFNKQGIGVKNLDIRQTQGTKYHAFLTLVFKSAQECYDYFGSIRNSVNKFLVINNDEWKIYEFIHKEHRKHDLGFLKHEPDERDEIVGNVFDEEESDKHSVDKVSDEESSDNEVSVNEVSDNEVSDEVSDEESSDEVSEDNDDDSISTEPEEEKDDELKEYEKIYNWLVTPDEEAHRKQIEEIKSLCKWLATPYWERT